MDPQRFDALTTFVASHPSRRRLLRALGGGLAIAFGGAGAVVAASCPSGVVCSGHCCPSASDICLAGKCTSCPSGVVCSAHCCPDASDVCISGQCTTCPSGVICSGGCCPVGATCLDGACHCDAGTFCGSGASAVCCGSGHECVHGGCFQITSDLSCAGCACGTCSCTVEGSGNCLCGYFPPSFCDSNADCPSGQACFLVGGHTCIVPC